MEAYSIVTTNGMDRVVSFENDLEMTMCRKTLFSMVVFVSKGWNPFLTK